MPVYKDNKNGTWYVSLWFTAWDGSKKKKLKRGFATKHEAAEYERKFHNQEQGKMEMSFSDFFQLYKQDIRPRLKLNTWLTKEAIITKHILPYFGNRVISDISAKDVIKWQNELRNSIGDNGKPISVQYLHTIHNQISAIFNHAVRFYDLPSKITLVRNENKLSWDFDNAETELWKEPPDPILEAIANLVTSDNPEWSGTATDLAQQLGTDLKPNVLTLKLNVTAGRLLNDYGIIYGNTRTHNGRNVTLKLKA